jgi:23S rRNA (guanosine2251-2'-O)-methyltransferase
VAEAVQLAADAGISILEVPRSDLDRISGGALHQGLALQVPPYEYAHPDELLEAASESEEPGLIVALDGVTDPRNLGAVLRAADGAGASGVIIPKDRAVGVTVAAVKASAGASEHVLVARVTNLRRAVDTMKEAGLWIYAAEAGGTPYTELDLAGAVALVLGSEGRGVRRLVRERCDGIVSIPMLGGVESLNVSVASAVLLYEARRRRGWP